MSRPFRARVLILHTQGVALGWYVTPLRGLNRRKIMRNKVLRPGALQFAPRYAQYLALILFAHWVDAQLEDADAFLARLNAWLAGHPPTGEAVSAFVPADLQLAAFWMATAAGKTHVLHATLALLARRRPWGRVLLVTPSESLTRQHAERLRRLATWEVFAYPMDGEAAALGRLPPETVIVLDINKLTA